MKKVTTILILFSTITFNAKDLSTFFTKTDVFMKKNVFNSKVDYQSIKSSPNDLNEILEIASKIDLSKETDNNTKAFWINAYNIALIKLVVNKYPVKSPLDISGLFDKTTTTLAGKKITLNDIENKMLREKYKDARIHFVLVCGANGCPPIINNAYMPLTLETQLETQTKLAINNPDFIKVNSKSKKVEFSQIFEWYKADFISKGKNEIDFINKYLATKVDSNYKVAYYSYDWTLNKK